MADFLLLVYRDEAEESARGPEADAELVEQFQRFVARNKPAVRSGQRLYPTTMATSVRRDADGGIQVIDGAFVESKEVVAGYCMVSADDLDEVLELAKQIPLPNGGIEIRPIRPTPSA